MHKVKLVEKKTETEHLRQQQIYQENVAQADALARNTYCMYTVYPASCKWRDAQRAMRNRQFIGYKYFWGFGTQCKGTTI